MTKNENAEGLAKERLNALRKKHPLFFPDYQYQILPDGLCIVHCVLYDQDDDTDRQWIIGSSLASRNKLFPTDDFYISNCQTTALSRACAVALGEDDPYESFADLAEINHAHMRVISHVRKMFDDGTQHQEIKKWINTLIGDIKVIANQELQNLRTQNAEDPKAAKKDK